MTDTSASRLLAHNIDALVALLALPVFLIAGWPVEGWFWATLFWALNRYINVAVERLGDSSPDALKTMKL